MAQFIAQTSRGLSDILENEVKSLGLDVISKSSIGVMFESDLGGCYKANLYLRRATRIIQPIHEFSARTPEELYEGIRKHDFTQYLGPKDCFSLDVSARGDTFRDQRFVMLKIKDGIVDQFREKFDERPDIDTDKPDVRFMVRVVDQGISVSLDTTGDSLSRRGYRSEQGEAPLREHLASGLVELAGWDEQQVILDPMCGSGTILIEAAMQLRQIVPGGLRKGFAFQKFKNFDSELWDRILNEAFDQELPPTGIKLFGSDQSTKMIRISKQNAERAGVETDIVFDTKRVDEITPPAERGLIIINPPYGERMGVTEDLKDVYRDLAFVLKQKFKGWSMWMISGNDQLTAALKFKATRKIQVYNGNLDCRFLEYKIN